VGLVVTKPALLSVETLLAQQIWMRRQQEQQQAL
jgi:hypothetical protein